VVVLVKQKTEQVAVIQASLDMATVELTDLQKVAVNADLAVKTEAPILNGGKMSENELKHDGENMVTDTQCLLRSSLKAAESMTIIRKEIAEGQDKYEEKADEIAKVLDVVRQGLDRVLFKLDTPQVGVVDRLNDLSDNQSKMADALSLIQQALVPLVNNNRRLNKWLDIALGCILTYTLVRLLPYIGILLAK
jgi:hypothetical protein